MKDKSTYRYPRTMQEAFGPYTDHQLHRMGLGKPRIWLWVVWGVLLITVGVGLLFI